MILDSLERYLPGFIIAIALWGVLNISRSLTTRSRAQRELFYLTRRDIMLGAWRAGITGFGLLLGAGFLYLLGPTLIQLIRDPNTVRVEVGDIALGGPDLTTVAQTQVAETAAAVTPTPEETPTPEATPTITPEPTVGFPDFPVTPGFPAEFTEPINPEIEPAEGILYGPLIFGTGFNDDLTIENEASYFDVPFLSSAKDLQGWFSYTGMQPGVQWTETWYRDNFLLHVTTIPWNGVETGYGFVDYNPYQDGQEWETGFYRVDVYVGDQLVQSGEFVVVDLLDDGPVFDDGSTEEEAAPAEGEEAAPAEADAAVEG